MCIVTSTSTPRYDKRATVRDHCAARAGADPTPADAALVFAGVQLSFEAVDVAEALAAHARVSAAAAAAAVGATSFGARAQVAAVFSRGLDDAGKRALAAAAK